MDVSNLKHVYFIGIGGIGMSALARYFNSLGIQVSGYDKTSTTLTEELQKEGIYIHFEDALSLVPKMVDLVVYTPAIPKDHKGWNWIKEQGFPLMKRSEVLGLISRSKFCIAIAGTHGKTTTSTLSAHLLYHCGFDPSAFLGGIAVDYNSNFLSGNGEYVVLEADEFDRSFLHLEPNIAAIMSMDADHLDIYGHHEDMLTSFVAFAKKIKPNGTLILKEELMVHFSEEDNKFLRKRNINVVSFGTETADLSVSNVEVEKGTFVFDLNFKNCHFKHLLTSLPGKHNVENASVAIAIALQLGGKEEDLRRALATFSGIKRRFEFIHKGKKVVYIDDYAHHPTELKAAIDGVRMLFPEKKITGIFQPHLYSRTRDFYDGFAEALDLLDEVMLMDIYPARELPIEGVSSEMIFKKMNHENKRLVSKAGLMDQIPWDNLEVLVTLGAGDIDVFVPKIKEKLEKINQ